VNSALAILGALGGGVAFLSAIAIVARAIFKEVSAIDNNTTALNALRETVTSLDTRLTEQGERLSRLEGRIP
jgi:uncharacterized protein HemX